MRASGETQHPISSKCRKTLCAILSICHHAIVDDSLRSEWAKHSSRYAKKWWGTMSRRGKIDEATEFKAGICFTQVKPKDRDIIQKDRMLVDIAYGTGRIIISIDEEIRAALKRTGNEKFTREIRWFNPCSASEDFLERL
jgi:hypothetical protein